MISTRICVFALAAALLIFGPVERSHAQGKGAPAAGESFVAAEAPGGRNYRLATAAAGDQECMICHDSKTAWPSEPTQYFVTVGWGSEECEGVGKVAPHCVRCENFDLMGDDECGDDGLFQDPPWPGYYTAQDADWWLGFMGCDSALCGPAESPTLDQLVGLELAGEFGRLAELIEASGGSLALNRERGAVQALDCSGQVMIHLPVGERSVLRLAEILDQNQQSRDTRTAGVGLLTLAALAGVTLKRRR